mmetsp:Transcript_44876/g.126718  ORF Transcript_44876/g.126718 Transcript_44876/m.126718 type:complete len:288 (+) Transcript_44876:1448-2311(+)
MTMFLSMATRALSCRLRLLSRGTLRGGAGAVASPSPARSPSDSITSTSCRLSSAGRSAGAERPAAAAAAATGAGEWSSSSVSRWSGCGGCAKTCCGMSLCEWGKKFAEVSHSPLSDRRRRLPCPPAAWTGDRDLGALLYACCCRLLFCRLARLAAAFASVGGSRGGVTFMRFCTASSTTSFTSMLRNSVVSSLSRNVCRRLSTLSRSREVDSNDMKASEQQMGSSTTTSPPLVAVAPSIFPSAASAALLSSSAHRCAFRSSFSSLITAAAAAEVGASSPSWSPALCK